MPYKISGTKSETARVIIFKESDWSIESETVVSGSGFYEVDGLESGAKTTVARANDGELLGYGSVTSVYYEPAGGTLWTWGQGLYGQLGHDDIVFHSSPVQVGALTTWAEIDTRGYHSAAIKEDGTLWTWGSNNTNGRLGLGDLIHRSSPTQVGVLTDWSVLGCGMYTTTAIKTNGTLWTCGNNNNGQLGLGDVINRSSPTQVGSLTNWSRVEGSHHYGYHTAAIKTDGTLWTWGNNPNGQLGIGTITDESSPIQVGGLSDWDSISCGDSFVVATKTDDTLWAWGTNTYGQLGQGNITKRSSPVQIGSLTTWSSVSCGDAHTAVVKTDGTLWTWGYNNRGQLGDGSINSRSSPAQVGSDTNWNSVVCGSFHTHAIKSDGTLWGWGANEGRGQLGLGDVINRSSPTQVGSLTTWTDVVGGYLHTMALQSV
jgi:alpha-tubulin suppressor-like RCC1 family protein